MTQQLTDGGEHAERMRLALLDIVKRAGDCYCDRGYPGGCGCGHAMGDIAIDALCLTPDKYGACGICDACKEIR